MTHASLTAAIATLTADREELRSDLLTGSAKQGTPWYDARVNAVHAMTRQIQRYEDMLYQLVD